jgi:purine catabolism regulator
LIKGMVVTLRQIMTRPGFAAALPEVLAGEVNLDRPVRWVHSSEVIEIASLLQGGELLLTGGTVLAESSERDRRRYLADLAGRGVAGIAIETGVRLPIVPHDIVEEAMRFDFPLIELRRVVPFVEIAEEINSVLANQSVANLRFVAELAHELSGIVGDGGEARELLAHVATRTTASAVLYDRSGVIIEAAGDVGLSQRPVADEMASGSSDLPLGGITTGVAVRRVQVATLWLEAKPTEDIDRLRLASTTIAEFLSLALLRARPPSTRDLAASELVRLASAGGIATRQLESLGGMVEFRPGDPVVSVVSSGIGASVISGFLGRFGRFALDAPSPTNVHALVSLREHGDGALARAHMLRALRESTPAQQALIVVVGPVVPSLMGAALSLNAALEVARLEGTIGGHRGVIDAHDHLVDRLMTGEGQRDRARQLVDGELAMFDSLPAKTRASLLETLEVYLDSGCDKSATARALQVTRQALYGRLARIFSVLGGDPTGTRRALGLHFALRMRHVRR